MMTDNASNAIISVLNENDVLLGRGRGRAKYVGNERFRALARVRKQDYKRCNDNGLKTSMAHDIFHEVVDTRGGRFLQLVNDGNAPKDVLETGKWRVASFKASIEKCKQALREKEIPNDIPSEGGREYGKKKRNSMTQGPLAKRQKTQNQVPFQTKYPPSLDFPGAAPPQMLVANTADGTGSRSVMNQSLEGIQQKILLAQHQAMMQRRVAINGLVKSMHNRSGSSQNLFRSHIPIVGRLVRPPLSALGSTCRPTMATTIGAMSRIVSRDSSLTEIEKSYTPGRASRPLVAVAPKLHAAASSAYTLAMSNEPVASVSREKPCITDAEKDAVSGLFNLAVAVGTEPNSNGSR